MHRSMKALCAAALAFAASACATMPAASPDEPTLADLEAIEATMYRYARGLDRHDPDLYASAWAEDAEFELPGVTYTGRDEMRGIIDGLIETAAAREANGEPVRQLFHMDANARVEFLSADHAIHHAYFLTFVRTGEGAGSSVEVISVGSTEDELRKIDGDWLVVKRVVNNGP